MTPTLPRKNSDAAKSINLEEIAALVDGELVGNSALIITGVAGIKEAHAGDITFLANPKYEAHLSQTQASAVITSRDVVCPGKTLVRTENPSQAFTKIVSFFSAAGASRKAGIHSTAVIGKGVHLGSDVFVGPYVVIEEDATIGDRCAVEAHTFVGAASIIADDCHLYPHVTIGEKTQIGKHVIIHSGAVIGSDGFGYETINGIHHKIPQMGNVCIEEDVEIGANVCIDRGRFESTWIKKGTKIDNLVQIAHNVVVGDNSIIVSQAGISGSTEIGKNVIIAGQAGLVGHIKLGDGVVVGAGAGVTKSFEGPSVILGSPAKPIAEQKKLFVLIARLPELFKDLGAIKKKLGLSDADNKD